MNLATPSTDPTTLSLDSLVALRHAPFPAQSNGDRGITSLPGTLQTRQRGQGLDFYDMRRYQPGDDVRLIDWNVTARTSKPHIRLYHQDRERASNIAIDLRSSMFTGSKQLLANSACYAAATYLWQAAKAGDRCGAIVLSNRGIRASKPRSGEQGVLTALGLLVESYNDGLAQRTFKSESSLQDLIQWILNAGRTTGACLLLSHGQDLGDDDLNLLKQIGAKGTLGCVLLRDFLEANAMPSGRYTVASGNKTETLTLSNKQSRQLFEELEADNQRRTQLFKGAAIPVIDRIVGTSNDSDLIRDLHRERFL